MRARVAATYARVRAAPRGCWGPATLPIWAVLLMFLGSCGIAQTGIGVDRPGSEVAAVEGVSLGLFALGVILALRAFRAAGIRALLPLVVGALALGPCGVFYLGFNGLPPFEVSDGTGVQYAIHQSVPGEVRYRDGYTVGVGTPTVRTGATEATRIWLIPLRFSNDRYGDDGHVARCSLYVAGRYLDPHRERADVRSLGDVDRPDPTRFPAGGAYVGRVAFELGASERDVVMECVAHAHVSAYFDLRPYAAP